MSWGRGVIRGVMWEGGVMVGCHRIVGAMGSATWEGSVMGSVMG